LRGIELVNLLAQEVRAGGQHFRQLPEPQATHGAGRGGASKELSSVQSGWILGFHWAPPSGGECAAGACIPFDAARLCSVVAGQRTGMIGLTVRVPEGFRLEAGRGGGFMSSHGRRFLSGPPIRSPKPERSRSKPFPLSVRPIYCLEVLGNLPLVDDLPVPGRGPGTPEMICQIRDPRS